MTAGNSGEILRLSIELRRAHDQLERYGELLLTIQRSILPQQLATVAGLDLAVHFVDADGVGGDFYDVHPVGPDRWAIVIADVVGHGLAAAALLAMVHALSSSIRGQDPAPSPGEALSLVNRPLATRYFADTGQFVTAFAGQYDVRDQTLTYASAGHPRPRLIRGCAVQRLDAAAGMPLGVSELSVYTEAVVRLRSGDRLVFFTDGFIENKNESRKCFGDERLDEVLRAPAASATELLDRLVHSVRAFRAGQPLDDDETCLVALVKPNPAETQQSGK
jgi:sigma-B regulation protein RsbU (phosphoserine phosphatase)